MIPNRGFRIAYWIAYRILRQWWFIRRPAHRGALVALWHGARILLVRTSYRPGFGLPGGSLRRNETPIQAARREIREECGLDLSRAPLSLAFETVDDYECRQDYVSIFAIEVTTAPEIRIDGREIAEARFCTVEEALALRLSPHLRRYLMSLCRLQGLAVPEFQPHP